MKKMSHLDDKQIIEAVIDERALDAALHRHLFECSVCHAQKEELQAELARLGQISRSHMPENFRKPTLSKNIGVLRPTWKIRPALGLGVAFASILALLLSPLTLKRDRLYTQDMVYREMLQDEKFMTEIEKLEENPLPRFYVDIGDPGDDERDIQGPGALKDNGPTEDESRNA